MKNKFDIDLACHYYDLGQKDVIEDFRLPLIIGCVCLFLLGIVVGVCI